MLAKHLATLRLIRTPGIGSLTYFGLLRRFGSPEAALEALPELAKKGGRKTPLIPPTAQEIEQEAEKTLTFGARFLFFGEEDYPAALTHIPDAPPVLTMLGNAALLHKHSLAVVGSRNASATGCQIAQQLSREVGQAGYVITSGLARGIDAFAHKAALETGTVGVIAGGIDNIYPPENKALYAQMAEKGAIITEHPIGQMPFATAFPARNRIIAGLSAATLVVEAAPQSGSLITARLALEYGRELLAVPGSPLEPRSKGCNQLIRDGAVMVESAADILTTLAAPRPPVQQALFEPPSDPFTYAHAEGAPPREGTHTRAHVIEKLGTTPVLVDELIEQCETSAAHVLTILLELELAGKLKRSTGNKVYLTAQLEEIN